jgi:hydroxysqualene dehydroxylase
MSHVHVIGAGLAGLAAALTLTRAGRSVTVHEAGPAAGGRCRSYFDKELDLRIDNGNHLLLSGNSAARAYIAEIGATDRFHSPGEAVFPFFDIKTGKRWRVRPNGGRIPWWVLVDSRRVPDTRLLDYLRMARIVLIDDDRTVAEAMRHGWLFSRLLEPLAVAALNTNSDAGLARLLSAVMRETLMRGGRACIPLLPKEGLSEALVDPAIATLVERGSTVQFNSRIAQVEIESGRITALRGPAGDVPLAPGDAVVLAVPPWAAVDLLPSVIAPNAFEAILNIHFRHATGAVGSLVEAGFVGLISGTAEWVFLKQDHVSVTISAANRLVDAPAAEIASWVWPDVRAALGLAPTVGDGMPVFRVVKERRATFAATAEQQRRRPGARTTLADNLAMAGDWIDTGLPATIEGAIRSGRSAAEVVLSF